MINPIPFLSLFNASLTSFPSTSPSASLSGSVECYRQAPSNETQLSPIIYKECREAIASIPMGEKSLAPITWARSPDAGFEVPAYWKHGNCVIGVDVKEVNVQETESFAAVLRKAFDLTITCAIQPPHLGGKALLGRREELEIFVYGDRVGV